MRGAKIQAPAQGQACTRLLFETVGLVGINSTFAGDVFVLKRLAGLKSLSDWTAVPDAASGLAVLFAGKTAKTCVWPRLRASRS
eukprot:7107510-Karenia_brevis.AAC.1